MIKQIKKKENLNYFPCIIHLRKKTAIIFCYTFSGAEDDLIEPSNSHHMIELVFSWAKENLNTEKPRFDDLTEQVCFLLPNSSGAHMFLY